MDELLRDGRAQAVRGRPAHIQTLRKLLDLARSAEIRDLPWTISEDLTLYAVVFGTLQRCWTFGLHDDVSEEESLCLSIWMHIHDLPEYDESLPGAAVTADTTTAVLDRISKLSTSPGEQLEHALSSASIIRCLQHLWVSLCRGLPDLRTASRAALCKRLLQLCRAAKSSAQDAGHERAHVVHLLPLMCSVLRGLQGQREAKMELFTKVLLPLHQPNEMVLWRDQIPVLQTYHEELVRCVVTVFDGEGVEGCAPSALAEVLREVLKVWPDRFSSNTPKQVLLLHELETLLGLCSVRDLELVEETVIRRLVACVGLEAENIRPAQRALQLFKNTKVLELFSAYHAHKGPSCRLLHQLVEAMHRQGQVSWNPTVNKMEALGLKAIADKCPEIFEEACAALFPRGTAPTRPTNAGMLTAAPRASAPLAPGDGEMRPPAGQGANAPTRSQPAPSPAGALGVRAAELHGGYSKERPPPVTVTGVAPWAMQTAAVNAHAASTTSALPAFAVARMPGSRPALGIRPVGISSVPAVPLPSATMVAPVPLPLAPSAQAISHTIQDAQRALQPSASNKPAPAPQSQPILPPTNHPSVARMYAYMLSCYTDIFVDSPGQASPVKAWEAAQAGTSPVLLPALKFHDIVYGRVLGEGAFSVVKYARHIQRDTTQSNWPEFAVKIISAERLEQHHYAPLALREMAILRLMVHPNICRLVSHFRYKDAMYLVLEYAARGDLHSVLVNNGCLPHALTRFAIGEIAAALSAVHDLGFSFNDLKPENVLVTARGHIKLADFGGCRPIRKEARDLMLQSVDAARQLRSGDWREREQDEDAALGAKVDQALAQGSDLVHAAKDDRYEGTAAYMPPELFQHSSFVGNQHGASADSWGIGCVLHFCLVGKPRFYGDADSVREQWRSLQQEHHDATRVHFAAAPAVPEHVSTEAELQHVQDSFCEDLIAALLHRDPTQRPSAAAVMAHRYITHGMPAHTRSDILVPEYRAADLHAQTPPEWPAETQGKPSDDLWARRQFSSLWAPMPRDYSLQAENFRPVGHADDPRLAALLARPLPAVEDDKHPPMVEC